jgi:hypothetical protein
LVTVEPRAIARSWRLLHSPRPQCLLRRSNLEKQGDIQVHPGCPILVFGAMLDATLESIFGLDLISEGVAR